MRTCGAAELRTPWGVYLVGRPEFCGSAGLEAAQMGRWGAAEGGRLQQRSQLQNCQVAKERLKCTSAKPFLKDWTNHLNPPLEPVSKLKHVNSNKKDVLGTVMRGAQEDGKLGTKSTQQTGHTALKKASYTCQRAGGVHPVQPRNNMRFPASAQTRGRLPPSSSGHLNPNTDQKAAQETVTAAAPQVGNDHSLHSLNVGLQDRLVCNKENLGPQASTSSELIRAIHSNKNGLRKERVLAHRQGRAGTSRSILGQKGSVGNHQAKEEPDLDKFRKALPESRSMSQNTSNRTQPLQPSRFLLASSNLIHKNPGTKQGESTAVRQPGTTAGGSLKQHSQPPPVRRLPTKPPTLGKPQGTTNLKSSLNPGVTLPWPRPTVKEVMDRKDMKMVAPGHTAASQGTGHKNQSHSIHNSKTHVLEDELRSRRDQLKPELLKASGMQARRVPRTPSAADRRKQLEEWLASKGRTYKRPPMMLLKKQAVIPSCRKVKATKKQENPEQRCQAKINKVLTECLKLIEEGVHAEEISTVLSLVPQAEKFAKFWICQAKLLARSGPFDVLQLYREAVSAGAEPVEELRETALNILKDAGQKLEGEKAEEPTPQESTTPCPAERQPIASTPGLVGRHMTSLPPSVKLLVTSASRGREFLEGPELKFLTPVRRSLRTERAQSCYPEMLKDHDPVVSSLSEILDAEEETLFFFRKNKALPEVTELEGLSSYPPKSP
ncbi:cytoskeleton-associated protein 2-like isoform X2 [Camarhynchus parvulus]|uniref:cytoskeleton-associated protein 2-like isoform X2 n=1 Tax=Geospiza parvula TaxID=87175 RepID=UPI0012380756|nr:cytoskeleton-associated protein 2-like isoform X2 [Camarhynchus parvulus]